MLMADQEFVSRIQKSSSNIVYNWNVTHPDDVYTPLMTINSYSEGENLTQKSMSAMKVDIENFMKPSHTSSIPLLVMCHTFVIENTDKFANLYLFSARQIPNTLNETILGRS